MKLTQEIANNHCIDVAEHFLQGKEYDPTLFDEYLSHCIIALSFMDYTFGEIDPENRAIIENATFDTWNEYYDFN